MMAGVAQGLTSLKSLLELDSPQREAQDTIDSTISHLEELVLSLKRHRNELSPIAKLPDDIIGAIFVQHSLNANKLFESVKVAVVCKRWRIVALQTPGMWSTIAIGELTPTSLVETVLSRSKSTEIALCIDGWVQGESMDAIRPHRDRIATVTLEGDVQFADNPPWAPRVDETQDATSLPLLKTFILRSPTTKLVNPRYFPLMGLLQTLELRNVVFSHNWQISLPQCSPLKTLRLYFEGSWMGVSNPAGHASGLSAILAKFPLIEVLTLVCTELPKGNSQIRSEPATTGDKLPLQHLKRLTLHLPIPQITSLLRTICTDAPLEKIDLHCLSGDYHHQSRHMDDFVDALASTRLSAGSPPLLSVDLSEIPVVKSLTGNSFLSHHSIRLLTGPRAPRADRPSDYLISISLTRPVIIRTLHESDDRDLETFSLGVISAFKNQFQSVVNIAVNGGWSGNVWQALGRFPRISSLIMFSSTPLDSLATSLLQRGDSSVDSDPPSSSTTHFPALERLSVLNATFWKDGDIIQKLVKGLGDRVQDGRVKLPSLHFEGPKGLSQSDVDALAVVVQEVKVGSLLDEYGLNGPSFNLGALDLYY